MDLDGAVPLKDTWSASQYNKAASFVYSDAYTQPILELLSPHEGERILDMGCGTGELTHRLQEFVGGAGMVVGVDSSQNMLEKAWRNGVVNVFCCDIQSLIIPDKFKSLRGTFDAVFTNATLHWCKRDPSGVVRGVKHALRPGGRFVGEFGGYLNCVGVRSALHQVLKSRGIEPSEVDPWYFPQLEHYAKILETEGFKIEHISLNPRITPLPGPLVDWLRTFARNSLLATMSDEEAEQIMQEVSALCEPDMKDEKGDWAIIPHTRLIDSSSSTNLPGMSWESMGKMHPSELAHFSESPDLGCQACEIPATHQIVDHLSYRCSVLSKNGRKPQPENSKTNCFNGKTTYAGAHGTKNQDIACNLQFD